MLGLLPAGCGRTVSDTDTVSCDTFVYSVKGGDPLRLDRYTDTPAAEIERKKALHDLRLRRRLHQRHARRRIVPPVLRIHGARTRVHRRFDSTTGSA